MAKKSPRKTGVFNVAGKSSQELGKMLLELINTQPSRHKLTDTETNMALGLVMAGADLSVKGTNGHGALMAAIVADGLPLVHLILEKGADVNQPADDGITPFMMAAAFGSAEMICAILEAVPQPFLKDAEALTALDYARLFDRGEDIIELVRTAEEIYRDYWKQNINEGLPIKRQIKTPPLTIQKKKDN